MGGADEGPSGRVRHDVQVVTVHGDRTTVRVGDVFLKIDAVQARADAEVEAMALAPVPTPEVLWHRPPVLALAAVPGAPLGRVGEPSTAPASAWRAAGAAIRTLHDAPLPPRLGVGRDELAARLAAECEWLTASSGLPSDVLAHHRRRAESVLRPWTPVFVHGDLHASHVFVDGGRVTGIIDWSEAAQGDALADLASLSLTHERHVDDLLAGYGAEVDRDLISGWWSYRCLTAIRWLAENGYGAPEELPEATWLLSS
ncbi:phosphotransferase family enzyme [Motilibacter peucedani]|uniref:Phosphotransferase family enzyme n=1 Tax=Motilibacter peucedani TaxID=598650 RepID=A0A420XJT7_9ACTN|nr:phosphotransferase [Motilibacter peucedani]RKS67880.1 phosphotransferase family enzyme [Motilibacter peucedani]